MTIVTWDWREQPDWAEINFALTQDNDAFVIPVESGSDQFACVVAQKDTTTEQAQRFFDEHQFNERP